MILDLTQTEENYLKAIFSLSLEASKAVSTNAIAEKLATKASSVTDMVKKLSEKKLVNYKKYQGVALTVLGREIAVKIIRKHRLWEVFLVKHLDFSWDEVHDVAEQLEHVKSTKLVQQLDAFLEYPTHDPHGDPIPDAEGNIPVHTDLVLASLEVGASCILIGVKDTSTSFLKYLDSSEITLGTEIDIQHKEDFDNSMSLQIGEKKLSVSQQITKNLLVKKIEQ
jgi:DtxR family transcriptional regulator, Mn-dependent transcriptional regulator